MQYGSKIRTLTVHSYVPITFAHLSLLNVEQVINQPTSTISWHAQTPDDWINSQGIKVKCSARSGPAVSIMAAYTKFAADRVTLFLMGFAVDELWTVSAFIGLNSICILKSEQYQHS
jgi:hypothetical protein